MKTAKKRRQAVRRATAKVTARRRSLAADDKLFGAAMVTANKKGYPHMEWDGAQFAPTRPKPPPKLAVNVSIMSEAHKKFGKVWKGPCKGAFASHSVEAYTDTCCQTCTAGVDFIEAIGCPEEYLVPTNLIIP